MLKVLVVDDEYIMRQGLKFMIDWEGEGYSIVGEATNGDEAMKLVRSLEPDIIISDVVMPVMDGVDFTDAVHSIYPGTQIIILSGYDNFEYVKHTLMNGVVDYILKPTLTPEELRKVLDKAADRIPGYKKDENKGASSHERKLEGYLQDKEPFDFDEFKKAYFFGYYRLYAVSAGKVNGGVTDIWDAVYNKLTRELNELQVIKYISVMLRGEIAVVLFNYEMHDIPSLKEIIKRINDSLLLIYDGVFGLVSRGFTDISDIYEIYENDIIKKLDINFYRPADKLIYAEEDKAGSGAHEKFDFFKFNQLLEARQSAEAVSMIRSYNDKALESRMDSYGLKNQMKNLIYHFLDFHGLSDAERENKRYVVFSAIDGALDIDAYREAMSRIFDELGSLAGETVSVTDERMESMLSYISDNYKEDLKLEDLASEFSFNYNYLSTYFTQHKGEGFSDYLNRLRIGEACRLLEGSDIPISKIGMETGYSDHSYFSRVFKKLTGMTPSEYRRRKS